MNEKAKEKTVEIKIGHATYQVQREFVGKVSREELVITKLVEDKKQGA